jgi:type IV pilus assembly protein PilC
VVLLGLLVVVMVFVIPNFVGMYDMRGGELPKPTQILMSVSDFFIYRWYVLLLVVGGLVVGFRAWLSTDLGRTAFDTFKFHIPAVKKLLNKVYAARFSRTLSSLSATGVSLPVALTVTARSIINRKMEKELYKVVDGINRGEELSTLLERMTLLPDMVVYLTRLGEESGTMDTLLHQASEFYDEEADATLSALMALLEPALIIFMAMVVVPILIAVLLPMLGMYDMLMPT